ncbi:ankyrin repeat-containing domain protein [Aspergillus cavernicola]|uniref:Ankyrin repeat-containing domain protein n=1 Tax=Aspergillus cavernicola TaxID=176166 RepID=A0ABR4I126_9EURO
MVQFLLRLGADVDALDFWFIRKTALHYAAEKGCIRMVTLLLEAGARVNPIQDTHGLSVLQTAVGHGTELLQTLINFGADVNAPASKCGGGTALQLAALNGKIAEARLLLKHGADVNAAPAQERGATALQYAAIKGNYRIVYMLLRAGADIAAYPAPRDGRTALEGAAEHGRLDTVALLLQTALRQGILDKLDIKQAMKRASQHKYYTVIRLMGTYTGSG